MCYALTIDFTIIPTAYYMIKAPWFFIVETYNFTSLYIPIRFEARIIAGLNRGSSTGYTPAHPEPVEG
jgi:hypothetical protein